MSLLHLQYKQETGKQNVKVDLCTKESEYIPEYYLIQCEEIDSLINPLTGGFELYTTDYVDFLEEKLLESQKLIESKNL